MARLLVRLGVLIAMFAVLLILVRMVGNTAANPLATIFSEVVLPNGQKQVCWHGICPSLTTLDEGKDILDTLLTFDRDNSRLDDRACWGTAKEQYAVCIAIEGGLIHRIELHYTNQYPLDFHRLPRLGDLVTLWGTPTKISRPFCGSSEIVFSNNVVIQFLWLSYPDPNFDVLWLLDPALPQTAYIGISDSATESDIRNATPWRGFSMFKEFMPCGGD